MSYNCSTEFTDIKNISEEHITELELLFEKAGLRANINYNNYLTDEIDYSDNPLGVIYNWASKNNLSFSITFTDEELEEHFYEYINGIEHD